MIQVTQVGFPRSRLRSGDVYTKHEVGRTLGISTFGKEGKRGTAWAEEAELQRSLS